MNALRHLITFFFKVAVAFFFFALVWWLVSLLFPNLSFRTLIPLGKGDSATSTRKDWLPAPKNYGSVFSAKATTSVYYNVYKPNAPYSGYNSLSTSTYSYSRNNYIMYKETGMVPVSGVTGEEIASADPDNQVPENEAAQLRSKYIRNLSIYEGGKAYQGMTFYGEAKSTMFQDGKFPVILLDSKGKVIGVSAAVAMSTWSVPGWVRFQTKVLYPIPVTGFCTFVFEQALPKTSATAKPDRAPLGVMCN